MDKFIRFQLSPQLQSKLVTNFVLVIATTMAASILVFGTIAVVANAKANEVPDPIATGSVYSEDPYGYNSGQPMRVCPRTGCSAPTCHAETGEPIPRQ